MSGRLTNGSRLCANHPQKLYQLPDKHLLDAMPVVKKIMLAVCTVDDNVLQAQVVHATGCAMVLYGLNCTPTECGL